MYTDIIVSFYDCSTWLLNFYLPKTVLTFSSIMNFVCYFVNDILLFSISTHGLYTILFISDKSQCCLAHHVHEYTKWINEKSSVCLWKRLIGEKSCTCLCLTWNPGCLLMCWFLLRSGQPSTEILLSTERGSPPSSLAPQDYQTPATEQKTSGLQTAS